MSEPYFTPKGYFIANKTTYVALFAFEGLDEMRQLARWMIDNGWSPAGHIALPKDEKKVDYQPNGFTPTCPDHKIDMTPSQHGEGNYYCKGKTNGQRCLQRYNKRGFYKARTK